MTSYLSHEANQARLADLRRWASEHPRVKRQKNRRLASVLPASPRLRPARAI